MMQKIKQWANRRSQPEIKAELFTRDDVVKIIAEVKAIAYTDGKRDGLTIAREQATKSLQSILKAQNKES